MPFVKTFHDLQNLQRHQQSLLRADFDAVVEIDAYHPFRVRQSCKAFDDLAGKSMLGESILDAASGDTAAEDLNCFLASSVDISKPRKTCAPSCCSKLSFLWQLCSVLKITAWPSLERKVYDHNIPLAPKIHSTWRQKVEVFIVGGSVPDHVGEVTTLLAVRLLEHSYREPLLNAATNSMDFHKWSRALDAKFAMEQTSMGLDAIPEGLKVSNQRPQATRSFRSHPHRSQASTRSSARSTSTQDRIPLPLTKRKILGLESVRMEFDIAEGRFPMRIYSFYLPREYENKQQSNVRQVPSIMDCIIGKLTSPFVKWLQESANSMMYDEEIEYLEYHAEVMFRPPTAACASSRIFLCAESATLAKCRHRRSSFDCSLMLHNVSQVFPGAAQCMKEAAESLPVVSETLKL
jgi:hypothetical protein